MKVLLRAGALAFISVLGGCGETTLVEVYGEVNRLGVNLGETAVVTGDYERIEEFLVKIEAPFTLYDGWMVGPPEDAQLSQLYAQELRTAEALLGDPDGIQNVDTLFINCGVRGSGVLDPTLVEASTSLLDSPTVRRNLRHFVEEGGIFYIADQSYNLLEAAIPEAVDFWGPDEVLQGAEVGMGGSVTLEIMDDRLEFSDSAELRVELDDSWVVSHRREAGAWLGGSGNIQYADGVEVQIPGIPIMQEVSIGAGRVYFSSLHNDLDVDTFTEELRVHLIRAMGGAL